MKMILRTSSPPLSGSWKPMEHEGLVLYSLEQSASWTRACCISRRHTQDFIGRSFLVSCPLSCCWSKNGRLAKMEGVIIS